MTRQTGSLHLEAEMETFVLAMNNKHSCEGNWWGVVSNGRKGYKPCKYKPAVRMCWANEVFVTVTSEKPFMRMLTRFGC